MLMKDVCRGCQAIDFSFLLFAKQLSQQQQEKPRGRDALAHAVQATLPALTQHR